MHRDVGLVVVQEDIAQGGELSVFRAQAEGRAEQPARAVRGNRAQLLVGHRRVAALDHQPVGRRRQVRRRVCQGAIQVEKDARDAHRHAATRRNAIM
ncbi:hypothetical protein D3C72_1839290 [compost metagenome]